MSLEKRILINLSSECSQKFQTIMTTLRNTLLIADNCCFNDAGRQHHHPTYKAWWCYSVLLFCSAWLSVQHALQQFCRFNFFPEDNPHKFCWILSHISLFLSLYHCQNHGERRKPCLLLLFLFSFFNVFRSFELQWIIHIFNLRERSVQQSCLFLCDFGP